MFEDKLILAFFKSNIFWLLNPNVSSKESTLVFLEFFA